MEAEVLEENLAPDWMRGDAYPIYIPDEERLPLPPSNELQGRFAAWNSEIEQVHPLLKGKSVHEVEEEASRMRLGESFCSFNEFDRCLDSWSVLHGRVSHRFKTKYKFRVRVCRFGAAIRPRWRGNNSNSGPDSLFGTAGLHEILHETEFNNSIGSQNSGPDSEIKTVGLHEADFIHLAGSQNASPDSQIEIAGLHEVDFINLTGSLEDCGDKENAGELPHSPLLINSRAPLQEIHANTMHQSMGTHNSRREFVAHTREWIPASFPQRLAGRDKVRRQSKTGACGQQCRFLPPQDSDNTELMQPCPFRVRCQREKDGKFTITVCDLQHTCPGYKHKWRGPVQKSAWLGETLAPRVVLNVQVPVKEMLNGLRMDYKKSCNYHQMWRARELVRDWYLGGQRQSFLLIPSLLDRMKDVDPNCVVDWSSVEGGRVFNRAFICPSATRTALQYSQPVVCIDACHTKNRKYPIQLFVATALDGNSQVNILCYAIAPVENTDNWTWFLSLLEQSIHGIADPTIPVISDRQKGLQAAVKNVFPTKVHGHCANHLRANLRKRHGKGAERIFLACVYANTKRRFELLLNHLSTSVTDGANAVKYIRDMDENLYARHAFPLPRLGKVTSNPVEQANSGLLPIREFAPFKVLVELWYYVQTHYNNKEAAAIARQETYSQQALKRHTTNLQSFGQWQVLDDGQSQAKVQTTDQREEYLVTLSPKLSCSCVELQEMLWPCEHIMAWYDRDGKDFTQLFHHCWKMSSLRKLYEPKVPCFLVCDLDPSEHCLPPIPAVKKGRHRVVRIERGNRPSTTEDLAQDEYVDEEGNLFRQFPIQEDSQRMAPMQTAQTTARSHQVPTVRQTPTGTTRMPQVNPHQCKCSICGQVGHNKRTCHVNRATTGTPQIQVPEDNGEALHDHARPTSQTVNPSGPFAYSESSDNSCESDNVDTLNSDEEPSQVSDMDHFISIAK